MIQIGRVGGDVTFDRGPATAAWQGDRLTLTGHLQASSTANQQALRQQLLGHADNPDEPVIPIIWPYDTDVTGFYRVLGVGVELFQKPSEVVAFDLSLERVPGYQAPLFELWSRGTVRVNAHSITSTEATPWIGLPDGAMGISPHDADLRVYEIDGELGDAFYFDGGVGADQTWFYDKTTSFYLPAANYYDAAATLEVNGNVVVGEQIINDPLDVVLTNGLLSIVFTSGNLTVSVWTGAAMEEVGTFWASEGSSFSTFATPRAVTALRNSPEVVSIRLNHDLPPTQGSALSNSAVVDLTLRRGARYVEGFTAVPVAANLGVAATASVVGNGTGTGITGGIMRDGADANGNTWVMSSPIAHTEDLTTGQIGIYSTATVTEFPWMVGVSTGTDAVLPNPDPATIDVFLPQGLIYQYHAAIGTRQNLAVR